MDFVLVVLAIAVVATGLYFVATLIFGPGEPPPPAGETPASPLPAGRPLDARDLRSAVLPVTVRGYRMADVDALIERMAKQLEQDGARWLDPADALAFDPADQPDAAPARRADPVPAAPSESQAPGHLPEHAADGVALPTDHGHHPLHAAGDDQ